MVASIAPYPIRGALWYQGESDIDKSSVYPETMRALISGWRRVFNAGDFPFYFVQLPPYGYGAEGLLPAMWEAQAECLSIPNTGMVTTVDVGNPKDIHPARKREVGERLALLALARTYGLPGIEYSGPVFKRMTVIGDAAVLEFDHAAGGLMAKDGAPLTWFVIAGADMKFFPAQAVIDGSTVVVRSDSVKTPAAVRFAWSNLAEPNLFNAEGLPAWPFRTDGPKSP
jgi:sialate O-acetylesterase